MDIVSYRINSNLLARVQAHAGNIIKGINSWTVSVVRHDSGIIDWTVEERQAMDRNTRRLLTVYRALDSKSDKLQFKRSQGGRGLINSREWQPSGICREKRWNGTEGSTPWAGSKESILSEERKERYMDDKFHGQFLRATRGQWFNVMGVV